MLKRDNPGLVRCPSCNARVWYEPGKRCVCGVPLPEGLVNLERRKPQHDASSLGPQVAPQIEPDG